VERSEFTSWRRAWARARVIGPRGGLVGLEAVVSEGHPVSISKEKSFASLRRKYRAYVLPKYTI
jgi:hypothetical protein